MGPREHIHTKLQDSSLLSRGGKGLYNARNTFLTPVNPAFFNFLFLLLKYLIKSCNWCLTNLSGRNSMLQELLFKVKRICYK